MHAAPLQYGNTYALTTTSTANPPLHTLLTTFISLFDVTMYAGSALRYNSQHGAQLMNVNSTHAEIAFWAATSPTSPTLVDCYTLVKQGSAVTYSGCMPVVPASFSLLTGGSVSDTQPGTANQMAWR